MTVDTKKSAAVDTTEGTGCCDHFVRDGLSATYPDGCMVEWDADGFTFTHAHDAQGEAVVTFEEEVTFEVPVE